MGWELHVTQETLCRSLLRIFSGTTQYTYCDIVADFNPRYFLPRYLVQNFDWLEEKLGDVDDDYILFDCPGVLFN